MSKEDLLQAAFGRERQATIEALYPVRTLVGTG